MVQGQALGAAWSRHGMALLNLSSIGFQASASIPIEFQSTPDM